MGQGQEVHARRFLQQGQQTVSHQLVFPHLTTLTCRT